MREQAIEKHLLQKYAWVTKTFTSLGDDIYLVSYLTTAQVLQYCLVDRGLNLFTLSEENMRNLFFYFHWTDGNEKGAIG